MSCTICQHPQRQAIDQALMTGSATLVALSQEYGLSTSALHRHKAHLQAKVNRAKDQLQDQLHQGCLFWLSQALEMAMQTAKAAQAEGDGKLVLQALRQGTRFITIILKQDLHLDDRVVYEILASPQWSAQDSLLPHDPQILAAGRQSLAGALSSPCPESVPPSSDPLADLDQLTENFLNLAQQAAEPQTENRKLKTINRLFKRREKGGKLPGKTPFQMNNNEENQSDKLWAKISALGGLPSPVGNLLDGVLNSNLAASFPNLEPGKQSPADMALNEFLYEHYVKDSASQTCPAD
jgi:hypothetical protein